MLQKVKLNINRLTPTIMKKEIVIDANNLYIIALVKIFNEFVIEEAAGRIFNERRLKSRVEKAAILYEAERKKLIDQNEGKLPVFGFLEFSKYKTVLK